jgi:hypothetical protein
MTTITRPLLRTLRDEINAALAEVGARHGVTLVADNVKFTDMSARFVLSVNLANETVQAQIASGVDPKIAKAEADYKEFCQVCGADPAWLGQRVRVGSGEFKVVGLLPNKHKNCILIQRISTGKNFIVDPATVRSGMSINKMM